jgi:hypothetical protein
MNTFIEGKVNGQICATCRICQVKMLLPVNMYLDLALDRLLDFAADHEKCRVTPPKTPKKVG